MRRRTWTVVVALLLSGLAGLVGYLGLRQAWAWWHYQEAQAALGRQDYGPAADHLSRCLDVWPHDRATLLLAARTARRADRLEEALRLQNVWRAEHGISPELKLEWRLLEAQKGRLQELEPFLIWMVEEKHPDTPLILEALTQSYIKAVRVRDALRSADLLLRLQPDHVRAWVWRGWAREHLERNEEALDDYRQAIVLKPDYAWARLCLGVLLVGKFQRFSEGLEQFQWLWPRQPGDPDVGLGLARCLRGVGQVDKARTLLDDLTAKFPTEGLILSERGQLALEEGQPELAEQWLRRAADLTPFDGMTRFALYQCLLQLGRAEEADQHIRRHEQIVADQARLQEVQRELSKSEAAAERLCEAGVLCLRLGRPEEGEYYLLAALQDSPTYLPARRALAEHYEKTGRPDLAAPHRAASSP